MFNPSKDELKSLVKFVDDEFTGDNNSAVFSISDKNSWLRSWEIKFTSCSILLTLIIQNGSTTLGSNNTECLNDEIKLVLLFTKSY